ncbi:hypothetical protein RJP56_14160 [Shewanella baltica]|uniref:hypothetical protein n=1 Tax=Shewanella baltica TaxID=62322 RepID=UPI002870FD03|nr:hypothetical protein [Shewanella baltica]MDR9767203.1 hypothetical protein [Shewanella baltica]
MQIEQSKPFILHYATQRVSSSSPSLGGHYCDQLHMWVEDGTNTPIINIVNAKNAELLTKTNVQVEQDDESFSLEMLTKTKVNVESDDMDNKLCHLSELLTKTDVIQESDDNSSCMGIL